MPEDEDKGGRKEAPDVPVKSGLKTGVRADHETSKPGNDPPPELPSTKSLRARIMPHIRQFLLGVITIVAGAFIVWLLGLNGEGPGDRVPKGKIVSPANGDSVGRKIKARGILTGVAKNQHVWLAVRDGNLLFPQDSEITPPNGEWSLEFRQGGETKVIGLELLLMSEEGQRYITDRFEVENFSGISLIPGAKRLDVVENLQIRG